MPKPNPATPKQRTFLWRATARSWYPQELKEDIGKDGASALVGNILDHFKGESTSESRHAIMSLVEIHTGQSFEIDQLVNRPPKHAKTRAKRERRPSSDPIPSAPMQSEPKTGAGEQTINELLAQLGEVNALRKSLQLANVTNEESEQRIAEMLEKQTELLMQIEELKKSRVAVNEPKKAEYIKPKDYDNVVHVLQTVGQVFLRGPAGCGKTLMAKVIGDDLGRDVFVHSCAGGPTMENVIGSQELVVDAEGNQITKWEKALPLIHMTKKKTLTVMDETPALEPETAMGLNGLLERATREVSTKAGPVKRHADNWIICTGNTNGLSEDRKYVGAQLQDGSNVDRTPTINMSYEYDVESGILKSMGVKDGDRVEMLERMDHMRRACNQTQIPFDPSTRRLVTCAELYISGMTMDLAFEIALTNDVEERQRREIINW